MHHGDVDSARVALLRQVLSSTPWVDRTREFARVMRTSTRTDHGLLLVGTPEEEPWHLAAHLDDESRFAGLPQLAPVLVRHSIPEGAPAHLSIGLDRVEAATRGETLFIVAPAVAPEQLLERADDARRRGTTILSMHTGDRDLDSIAHESLVVPASGLIIGDASRATLTTLLTNASSSMSIDSDIDIASMSTSFDVMEHLVSTAVGETAITAPTSSSRRGFRDRLGRMLDSISGPRTDSL